MGWPHCKHCRHCAWCVRVCVCVRLPGIAPKVPGREDPDVLQGKDSKAGPSSTRFSRADYLGTDAGPGTCFQVITEC